MLMRFDPFREFDRLSQQVFTRGAQGPGWMPIDAVKRGDTVHVSLDLPGVDPGSIELLAEKGVLTIKAERTYTPAEGEQVLVAERPQGTFTRQLFLSDSFDFDKIAAHYDNGVLWLEVPIAEQAKPRRIEVKSGDQQAITVGEAA